MCEANKDIQIEIAKVMEITNEESSDILRAHLLNPPPELNIFISKLVTGNSTVCINFESGAIRQLCQDMLKHKDPNCADVLSNLCSCNGVGCERNIAIVVDCLVGHTNGMSLHLKLGNNGKHRIDGDPEWLRACINLLAAFVAGTNPKELEFVQGLVDFGACVAGICLPIPIQGEIQGRTNSVKKKNTEALKKEKKKDVVKREPAVELEIHRSDEEDALLRKLFDRYDLNANGVIDSQEELSQLTTNCAVKFKAQKSPSEIDALCSKVEISAFTPWSFGQFSTWFLETILLRSSPTKLLFTAHDDDDSIEVDAIEVMDKGDEDVDVADELDTAGPIHFTASTRDLLLIKGAYLKLWTQSFVNVNDDMTKRAMTYHEERSPPIASILPKGHPVCAYTALAQQVCPCAALKLLLSHTQVPLSMLFQRNLLNLQVVMWRSILKRAQQ